MKSLYKKPELNLLMIEIEDILLASSTSNINTKDEIFGFNNPNEVL